MGAFNQWVGDSFLNEPKERKAGIVAQNIMAGAAYLSRVNILTQQGVALTGAQKIFAPKTAAELEGYFPSSTVRTK